jgi:hypothetical protein
MIYSLYLESEGVMAKKKNLCIYCKEPYQKGKGWYSQKGKMWEEGETEEQGKPYQLFWHAECDPEYIDKMRKIRQEISQ